MNETKHWLQQILDENNLTRYQVYKSTGLSQTTMSDILKNNTRFSEIKVTTLHALTLAIVKKDFTKDYLDVIGDMMDRFLLKKTRNKVTQLTNN
jgi:predicted transcriptional regulator